jgi:2-polyprenyl-3-methyl-5-hydroxy-6-metoxy-1,4-benzoquinol methylase
MLLNSKPQLNVDAFNQDVVANAGYWYTTNAPLSSRLANLRNSEGIFGVFDFTGRRVIDIGCGDGCYTVELSDRGRPAIVCGIDPAPEAIKVARQKAGQRAI